MHLARSAVSLSVSTAVQLPDQPGDLGSVELVPLGGNGFLSPHSMYVLRNVGVTGDASGGTAEVAINCDVRYTCLFATVNPDMVGAAADVLVRMGLSDVAGSGIVTVNATMLLGVDNVARVLWSPSPFFGAAQIKVRAPNVDGDDLRVSGVLYNFDKRAPEVVPMAQLVASLPRSGTLVGSA